MLSVCNVYRDIFEYLYWLYPTEVANVLNNVSVIATETDRGRGKATWH